MVLKARIIGCASQQKKEMSEVKHGEFVERMSSAMRDRFIEIFHKSISAWGVLVL